MRDGDNEGLEAIRGELAGLRAELDAVRNRQSGWRRAVARIRPTRRLATVGIAALLLALPVAVSASHNFSDVPTSSTYHATISRLVGAGITGGCGSGKYCPNDAVTRGQMAAFLNRGLGRGAQGVDFGDVSWNGLASPGTLVATVDLQTGGGPGGTAHVFATANFNAWTDEPGVCPCEIQLYLYNPDTGEAAPGVFDTIGADGAPTDDPDHPGVYWQANASASYLFTVPSGAATIYEVYAVIVPTTEPNVPDENNGLVTGWASNIQVVSLPFTANGGNPDLPAIAGGGSFDRAGRNR